MYRLSVIILIVSSILANGEKDYPQVTTPLGKIRGYYERSEKNRLYEVYEGIPYSLPPTEELRFQPPQKIGPWVGELNATKPSEVCLQYSMFIQDENDRVYGSEDCLYLNIYVPVQDSPLPVIIWIHGGAFQFGAGSYFRAKYLADKDIILVTINYRLGPLGFLSTEDEIVPGNMGLKDQSMALRWVNENIKWFGGNPNKITLAGLSAGGASVQYHCLSPLSAGLFQNGISSSGTALNNWAQTKNSLEKAKKLGLLMGCPVNETIDMIKCLKSRPAKTLTQATSKFMTWLYNPFTPFGPVVEKSQTKFFINRSPVEIIASGDAYDVPWITGITSEEGLFPAGEFVANQTRLNDLNDNWNEIAPFLLNYNDTLPLEMHALLAKKIKNHYLGTKSIDSETVKRLIQLIGDRLFVIDAEKAARLQAKYSKSPVWFYYYSCKLSGSLSEAMSGSKEDFGVSHGDNVTLIFEQSYIKYKDTNTNREMREFIMDIWTSVATNGKPIPQIWTAVNPNMEKDFNFLHMYGPELESMDSNDNLGEKEFWNSIDFNENK